MISSRNRKLILIIVILFISLAFIRRYLGDRVSNYSPETKLEYLGGHRLAILVPFRDRFDELLTFVPYLTTFLHQQGIRSFMIYILNQSARYRFNRGALANVGYQLAKNDSDYIAIHDVDLVPLNKNLSYAYPKTGPYHMTAPQYHPNYNYEKYFGGILLIKNEHFELVNGFSNKYFGWGLEDDEFYTRIRAANLSVTRPVNLSTNKSNTFLHFHHGRKRDSLKSKEQRDSLRYRDRLTGLANLKFAVTSTHQMKIDESQSFTIYNIELYCDILKTPWCSPTYGKAYSKDKLENSTRSS